MLTANLRTLTSDHKNRDGAVRVSGLETNAFPKASFVLSHPINLAHATTATNVQATATGEFTLHGVTKSVAIPLEACRDTKSADTIEVVGHLPIAFADYDITAPSVAGFVSVKDEGEMEFQLFLTKTLH